MPFSGCAIVFLCEFCGRLLVVTAVEYVSDANITVTGRCGACGKTINMNTSARAMLGEIFAKFLPPKDERDLKGNLPI
jgi:transcription elongation factor Elf1